MIRKFSLWLGLAMLVVASLASSQAPQMAKNVAAQAPAAPAAGASQQAPVEVKKVVGQAAAEAPAAMEEPAVAPPGAPEAAQARSGRADPGGHGVQGLRRQPVY